MQNNTSVRQMLGYVIYRHFQAVIENASLPVNSGQRMGDHFVGIDEMVEIGSVPSPL